MSANADAATSADVEAKKVNRPSGNSYTFPISKNVSLFLYLCFL